MNTCTNRDSENVVKQALSFETPDRIPVAEGYIWPEFVDQWRRRYALDDKANFDDSFRRDLCTVRPLETLFPSKMRDLRSDGDDTFSDDGWGRIIRTNRAATFSETVELQLKKPADLDKLEFESADMDQRYAGMIEEARIQRARGKAVFVDTGGPFIRSSFIRGEVEFLMDLVSDVAFAQALAEKVGMHLMNVGLEALKRADAFDFGIWIYDDMCSSHAPLFSPAIFERVFLPVYKKMVSAYKDAGARWVILHCDGNLLPFLDLVVEAGIDGINPVEYAAGMNVVELIEKYYGRLSFIGGICNTSILPAGDEHQIRQHVESIVEAGRNGGLVVGAHSVGPDISVESFELYRHVVSDSWRLIQESSGGNSSQMG